MGVAPACAAPETLPAHCDNLAAEDVHRIIDGVDTEESHARLIAQEVVAAVNIAKSSEHFPSAGDGTVEAVSSTASGKISEFELARAWDDLMSAGQMDPPEKTSEVDESIINLEIDVHQGENLERAFVEAMTRRGLASSMHLYFKEGPAKMQDKHGQMLDPEDIPTADRFPVRLTMRLKHGARDLRGSTCAASPEDTQRHGHGLIQSSSTKCPQPRADSGSKAPIAGDEEKHSAESAEQHDRVGGMAQGIISASETMSAHILSLTAGMKDEATVQKEIGLIMKELEETTDPRRSHNEDAVKVHAKAVKNKASSPVKDLKYVERVGADGRRRKRIEGCTVKAELAKNMTQEEIDSHEEARERMVKEELTKAKKRQEINGRLRECHQQ